MGQTGIKRSSPGFSLIELSIALLILGLIMIPFIQKYNADQKFIVRDNTWANVNAINEAIGDFYTANGYYPAPADRTLGPNDPNYGKPVAAGGLPGGNSCTAGNGICRGMGFAVPVLVGDVPFVALKIPVSETLDGWSRKLTYAVSENLTKDAATFKLNYDTASGINNAGVTIKTYNYAEFAAGNPNPSSIMYSSNAHFAIVSHGEDGVGAFNPNGQAGVACPTGATKPADAENCNNDGNFFDPTLAVDPVTQAKAGGGSAPGVYHFDDIIAPQYDIPTHLWNDSSAAGNINTIWRVGVHTDDVSRKMNPDGSLVAINPGNPSAAYDNNIALDVDGTLGAQQVLTIKLCDGTSDPTTCFTSDAIGGTGVGCSTGGAGVFSTAMSGIGHDSNTNDAGARCNVGFPVSMSSSCAPNHYAIGVSGGHIICN